MFLQITEVNIRLKLNSITDLKNLFRDKKNLLNMLQEKNDNFKNIAISEISLPICTWYY